eukprot:jgi/Botrbrau1/436/Bobra.110_2s0086.1
MRHAVVCCSNSPRVPNVPAWARSFLSEGTGSPREGCPSGIQLAADVDLRGADLSGKRVAIVGGGMTAATLTLSALKCGAEHVTLITRKPLATRDLTYELGWYGLKNAASFRNTTCLAERMWQLRESKGWGTMDAHMSEALREAFEASDSRLTLLERHSVTSADWDGTLAHLLVDPEKRSSSAANAGSEVTAQHVWLATGTSVDVTADPLLASVLARFPTQVVGGYPWLQDGTLLWPGLPLFVLGRLAALSLGPAAGEVPGMRVGAQKVAACLAKLGSGLEEQPWATALSALETLPVLETQFPLEGEHMEKRIAPKVLKAVDVSDLPAGLQRQEVQSYSWVDDKFSIAVTMSLDEEVQVDKVRTVFLERSLDIWVVGDGKAYHFSVPKLYDRIIPARCKIKLSGSGTRLHVLLHKQSSADWRFLKG